MNSPLYGNRTLVGSSNVRFPDMVSVGRAMQQLNLDFIWESHLAFMVALLALSLILPKALPLVVKGMAGLTIVLLHKVLILVMKILLWTVFLLLYLFGWFSWIFIGH